MEYTTYATWKDGMRTVSLPKWEELPKFDLYMDQLLEFVNQTLAPLGIDEVTATMVNNYVKKKVILAPIKKKYSVMQVADIILITMLKTVFALDVIRQGMNQVTVEMYPKQAYDYYIEHLLRGLEHISNPELIQTDDDLNAALIDATIKALLSKMNAEMLLYYLNKEKPLKMLQK
ncbi:DUF1836 domain-containing protein [Periweissella beninensis]|uniref:DUF1836 domain-containing protein n=1 Tax=Periweissella beninensis TaxID=504936 RepID=A0ABT0VJB5_9LACO|nr:DUF1836 domain-containing protein [Periweissella beninensis]MBM7543314.1 hypothetical protein [Periweissella beninensis]MCM2437925.1 DUF1836 domain-containing protein [Periweissella beninensis]MCT4395988.1 DUF1836 domain-containing protein [Periweissella beninensis]